MKDTDIPASISVIKGGATKDENAELIRTIRSSLEQVELRTLLAQYKKSCYDSYVAAGFTPAQALEMVK